jgi:hypothetical protein
MHRATYTRRCAERRRSLTDSIGVGTRFRVERVNRGRAVGPIIEFIEFERPRRLASRTCLSTMDIEGTLRFDTVRGGTRLQWLWDLKPRGVLRLMTPLLSWMGGRQEHATWTGLKRVLEAQEASAYPADPSPDATLRRPEIATPS